MAATIIDSLLVTLGLDPKQYIKGRQEVEREDKKAKDAVKKNSNELADALTSLAKTAGALFLGFESAKGAFDWLVGLNVNAANLGRFSKNLSQSTHEVNAWDNAVELAGGTAKDAEADLMGLSSSITALRATGEVSPLVLLLQRMNVQLFDAQGKTRKLTDIYKDLGDKLRGYNRADAFNLARQAGVSESTFNLIRAEADERERMLRIGEQNAALDDQNAAQAAELQAEWRDIGQEVKTVGVNALTFVTPYVKQAFEWARELMGAFKDSGALSAVGSIFRGIWDVLKLIVNGWKELIGLTKGTWIEKYFTGVANFYKEGFKFGAAILDQIHTLAGGDEVEPGHDITNTAPSAGPARRTVNSNTANNNPGNLRFAGQPGATLGANGFAKFPTLAAGIAAANRQLDLYATRGVNTISKIISKWAPTSENDTAGYIAAVSKQLGKGANVELTPADRQRLLQAIFNKEGVNRVTTANISGALGGNPAALDAARFASNGAQLTPSAAGARSSSSNVQIDQVTINTQATDANGIAAEIPPALKRKGVVAQSDAGMS
jgi:hypothetical protein